MQRQQTERNYINILIDSLKDKLGCLEGLIDINKQIVALSSAEGEDYDTLEEAADKKAELIERLDKLDDGFTVVYNRVRDELTGNSSSYSKEIEQLKEYIKKVTDATVALEVLEKESREMLEKRVTDSTEKLKMARTSTKVATNYYKNMTNQNYIEPQFVDKKK